MAYDGFLAERMERVLEERRVPFYGKRMFGGICYMVDEKMCVGIFRNQVMVRIDPENQEAALAREGTRLMDDTGQSMKGFIMVDPEYVDLDEDLESWIDLALEFNPRAKSSKKK
jgi:TfoX/Sxy family transcriptional regulator of competence genes